MAGKPAEIRTGKKQCTLCKVWKETSVFGTFLDKKKDWIAPRRYLNSRCKTCASKASGEWGKRNREVLRKRWQDKKEKLLLEIRIAYGNVCNCCGEKEPLFLTIDHINNDGYKLRPRNGGKAKVLQFSGHYYQSIIRAGFPKDLQLLCWNCNCGRNRNKGICPHKK